MLPNPQPYFAHLPDPRRETKNKLHGIPSHDTLSDVMGRLNPTAIRQRSLEWVKAALPSLAGQHVAIDGKTLRGSRGREGPVHLLSAFSAQARWVLAQCAVEGKSNEIKAIPKLLEMPDLEGATRQLYREESAMLVCVVTENACGTGSKAVRRIE